MWSDQPLQMGRARDVNYGEQVCSRDREIFFNCRVTRNARFASMRRAYADKRGPSTLLYAYPCFIHVPRGRYVRAHQRITHVSCKLRIHGLSAYGRKRFTARRCAITPRWQRNVPGQNESNEYTRDAYAGNVFSLVFCFSRAWLEYRICPVT